MRRITPLFMMAAILSLPAAAASIALTGVNLIDVEGLTVKSNQTVLLQDDRIAAIQPASKAIPKHYTKVDLTGKYVLPGLIDAHVHHATEPEGYNNAVITHQRLQKLLRGGVTSVRDMAGDVRVLAGLKRSAELDLIQAPDIYYSVILGGNSFFSDPRTAAAAKGKTPGETDWMRAVDENTDVDALMQRTLGSGASGIKIYADVPAATVKKLAAAAKRAGLKVWSHAYIGPDKPSAVVAAGVEVISHVPDLSAEVIGDYKAWRRKNAEIDDAVKTASFDAARYTELLKSIKQHNTILDVTLTVFEQHRHQGANREVMFQHGVFLTKLAREFGITLAAGTDAFDDTAALPMLHHELQLLTELGGLTPAQALQAATLNSAKAIGIDKDVGTVDAGKKANLLVLNTNPLDDIRRSTDIAHVIKNGRFVYRGDDERLPFSAAREAGGMLWLSGQIGNFPGTMTLAGNDITSQMTQAMDNIMAVLQQHHLTAKDVTKCTLMLADIKDWAKASEIYKGYFTAPLPARSAFAASGLALNAKVEIECVASL